MLEELPQSEIPPQSELASVGGVDNQMLEELPLSETPPQRACEHWWGKNLNHEFLLGELNIK